MINENVALAKSILNKIGINQDSDDYKDYLKIREIVGSNIGFLGILTRLRFIDDVKDMDEIQGIFDVLKASKMDVGKLNKMSYDEILSEFYDKIISNKNKDYELIYKDNTYSYFRVYTYKGILEIGSPSWCLKTKNNWDLYQSKYPNQWVVIENNHLKKIISPNTMYLSGKYVNKEKSWIRFGVSLHSNSNYNISYLAFNDNNDECNFVPERHTFFGIFATIINLNRGDMKSYYQEMRGCEYLSPGVFKIIDNALFDHIKTFKMDKNDVAYLFLSKTYNSPPTILRFPDKSCPIIQTFNNYTDLKCFSIGKNSKSLEYLKEFLNNKRNVSYSGLKIKLGYITKEEAISNSSFMFEVNNWMIFNWNDNYYIAVDSNIGDDIVLPTKNNIINVFEDEDGNYSCYYLIDKKEKNNYLININTPDSKEILNKLFPNKSIFKKFW